jgi:hypothetical protein
MEPMMARMENDSNLKAALPGFTGEAAFVVQDVRELLQNKSDVPHYSYESTPYKPLERIITTRIPL